MNTAYAVSQAGKVILDQALALSQAAENSQYERCQLICASLASEIERLSRLIQDEQNLRRKQLEQTWPTEKRAEKPASRKQT